MPVGPVPVTMGSPRFRRQQVRGGTVTFVAFPSATVLEPHFHDHATFTVVLSGRMELRLTSPAIRRSRLSCPPGTVFTQPAGEKHANYIFAGGATGVVIQPDLEAPELPRRCVRVFESINLFRDGPIGARARSLARELVAPDGTTPLAVEALVLEMFAEAARLDEGGGLRPGPLPPWLKLATDFVHARFRETVRIRDVAEAAGIDPARLAMHFRRIHRMPLGTYVRRLRLDWAADRLATTRLPIARIAVEAGYSDQPHLTRALKRATGSTPMTYRQARRRRTDGATASASGGLAPDARTPPRIVQDAAEDTLHR